MPEVSGPFNTPTVARIYAQQGKLEQARAIYRQLLAENPSDTELARALAQVEKQLAQRQTMAPEQGDTLVMAKEGTDLLCSWLLSDDGIRSAQLLLGPAPGELTLRLVGFPRDPDSSVRDIGIDREKGSARVPPPPGASFVAASVGLMDSEGTFVSVAHCDMVPV